MKAFSLCGNHMGSQLLIRMFGLRARGIGYMITVINGHGLWNGTLAVVSDRDTRSF